MGVEARDDAVIRNSTCVRGGNYHRARIQGLEIADHGLEYHDDSEPRE